MTEKAKITAEKIGELLNDFSFNTKDVCEALTREHRTLQQTFTRLCIEWLRTCADDNYPCDGRNISSHKVAKQLIDYADDFNLDMSLPFI